MVCLFDGDIRSGSRYRPVGYIELNTQIYTKIYIYIYIHTHISLSLSLSVSLCLSGALSPLYLGDNYVAVQVPGTAMEPSASLLSSTLATLCNCTW